VVPHINGKDYWVLVHGWNSNKFYAYPLASTTVGNPVITNIGSIHQVLGGVDPLQELQGEMKASPNGKKLLVPFGENCARSIFLILMLPLACSASISIWATCGGSMGSRSRLTIQNCTCPPIAHRINH
jgi:hypothetical protein